MFALPPPPSLPTLFPVVQIETTKEVPFYSQFEDVTSSKWKKKSCGIASLAMVVDYYYPESISVDTLLAQGIAAKGYIEHVGWTYKALISVANKYGLSGESYDLAKLSTPDALVVLKTFLAEGPVIVSVHYQFDPKSTIPHLVVLNGIENGTIAYNDPAAKEGNKKISIADFGKGWKKRFISIRP